MGIKVSCSVLIHVHVNTSGMFLTPDSDGLPLRYPYIPQSLLSSQYLNIKYIRHKNDMKTNLCIF